MKLDQLLTFYVFQLGKHHVDDVVVPIIVYVPYLSMEVISIGKYLVQFVILFIVFDNNVHDCLFWILSMSNTIATAAITLHV